MRYLTFLAALLLIGLSGAQDAMAGSTSSGLLNAGSNIVHQVYSAGVSIIYVIGGIGILVMASFAFLGRFKWGHFFSLAGGLFLVAATDQLISFLSGGTASSTGAFGMGLH